MQIWCNSLLITIVSEITSVICLIILVHGLVDRDFALHKVRRSAWNSSLLLLHHLLLCLCHLCRLMWIKLLNDYFAWQVVRCEQNGYIIRVEHGLHIQAHQMQICVWLQWNGLHEEHGILQSVYIWLVLSRPRNTDHTLLLLWSNKAHIRRYLHWNRR